MNPNRSKHAIIRLAVALCILGTVVGAIIAADKTPLDSATTTAEQQTGIDEIAIHVRAMPAGSVQPPQTYSRYRGTVRSRRESELAFRRGGRVAEIHVHEGDRVSAGELLAVLDTSDLEAERKRVTAELEFARAELSEALAGPRRQSIEVAAAEIRRLNAELASARADLTREAALKRREAGSDRSYDGALFAVDQLEASVAAAQSRHAELIEGTRRERIAASRAAVAVAEAAVARNEVDFQHVQILAPYDGLVARRLIDEGAVVSPDAVALHVIEIPPMEARFGLPNRVVQSLQPGDRIQIELASPVPSDSVADSSMILEATVKRIHPTLSLQTRTRDIDVLLKPDAAVIAGETVTLRLPELAAGNQRFGVNSSPVAIWVPTEALVRGSRGLWSLMVAVESAPGSIIERRDVEVLRTTGPFSEVSGMVQRGDFIVVEGVHRIGPGVRVIVKDPSADLRGEGTLSGGDSS